MAKKVHVSLPIIAALPPHMLKTVLEYDFQVAVTKYAEQHHWRVHYMRKSAMQGADGTWKGLGGGGWPDLFMVNTASRRAVAAELKAERGSATPEQRLWLSALETVPGIETFIWKPRNAVEIMERLK